jgi:UDP-N-acetylmuramoyl-tripeptide--D-alanyl-D-alanine ligase
MNIEALHKIFLKHNGVFTDTRNVIKNAVFFALKGDNFNGNTFANDAMNEGAAYAVIDEIKYAKDERFILVKDVLSTLQELALYHRKYLGLRIIALTGSNGKTTTKELIFSVLKEKYNTVATQGNLNNHIGVPLTLLAMNKETQIGIVEMGANHLNEIDFLCRIAEPDFGYITNFGKAHLEGFGSIEGVIKGKSELYNYLISLKKFIFINASDPVQTKMTNSYENIITFNSESALNKIKCLSTHPFVRITFNGFNIDSNLIGSYNFENICAALAIGNYFGVDHETLKKGIENYIPKNNRSQIISLGTNTIILDAYNANPSSMKIALDNFSQISGGFKIAILGDMFELGEEAANEHKKIAEYAIGLGLNSVYLVGENFYNTTFKNYEVRYFKSFEDLAIMIKSSVFENQTILIKGSRGMALERALDLL